MDSTGSEQDGRTVGTVGRGKATLAGTSRGGVAGELIGAESPQPQSL